MRGWRIPGTLPLAVPVALILVWLVLYPNLFVLADSLRGEAGITLDAYRHFFASPSEREALWNSVWLSAASVALSGAIGIPLAFLFSPLRLSWQARAGRARPPARPSPPRCWG